MKKLSQHEIQEHSMPVLNEKKLKRVWDDVNEKLNDKEFINAIYENTDLQTLNTMLWKINNKYKLHLM